MKHYRQWLTGFSSVWMILAFISLHQLLQAQITRTIDSLEMVLEKTGNTTGRVDVLSQLGDNYRQTGDYDKSLNYLSEAAKLAQKLNYSKGLAKAYVRAGTTLSNMRNHDESLEYGEKAMSLGQQLHDKEILGDANHLFGLINFRGRNFEKSLEYCLAAIDVRSEIRDYRGLVKTYVMTAKEYQILGKPSKAFEIANKAKDLANENGYLSEYAETLMTLGELYYYKGDMMNALGTFQEALAIHEKENVIMGIALEHQYIGMIFDALKNHHEAVKEYTAALEIFEKLGEVGGISTTLTCLGRVKMKENNFTEALMYYEKALAIAKEQGTAHEQAVALHSIGDIYRRLGDHNRAIDNYTEYLDLAEKMNDKRQIASALNNLGWCYFSLSIEGGPDPDKDILSRARSCADRSIELSLKQNNFNLIAVNYELLASIDSLCGNYIQAISDLTKVIQYEDSIRSERSIAEISKLRIQFEAESKDKEIELLTREKELNAIQVREQRALLLADRLEAEKNQASLDLMNNALVIEQLKLGKKQEELESHQARAKANAVELSLVTKEKELREQQLQKQELQRNALLAGIVLFIIIGLLYMRSVRMKKKLVKQQAILQERRRISADLHDDIGSGLSKISLLSEVVKQQAKTTEARAEAEKIASTSRELLDNIREIIWALNANNDYLDNLVSYIRRYASEYFERSQVTLRMDDPVKYPQTPISGEYRRNIFFSVKEVMHNIIKHAEASEAGVRFGLDSKVFSVTIMDNGKGIRDEGQKLPGHGIRNIRKRMEAIRGQVLIENHSGTKITLTVPV